MQSDKKAINLFAYSSVTHLSPSKYVAYFTSEGSRSTGLQQRFIMILREYQIQYFDMLTKV